MPSILLFVLALSVSAFGCGSARQLEVGSSAKNRAEVRDAHEVVNSVLWIQTSDEYDTLSRLTFRQAKEALTRARADKNWTAALEQTGDFSNLPDAIIVDIDATVLDSSPFQGKVATARTVFNERLWDDWAACARANGTPGASEFLS
jgi:acid phosphatase